MCRCLQTHFKFGAKAHASEPIACAPAHRRVPLHGTELTIRKLSLPENAVVLAVRVRGALKRQEQICHAHDLSLQTVQTTTKAAALYARYAWLECMLQRDDRVRRNAGAAAFELRLAFTNKLCATQTACFDERSNRSHDAVRATLLRCEPVTACLSDP